MNQSRPKIKQLRISGGPFSFRDERTLFDSIDLTLIPGDRVSLQGDSGSGKSTLLRLLAGLSSHSNISILWNDQKISDYPRYRTEVCYVPQNSPFSNGTVLQNLKKPFTFKSMKNRIFDQNHLEALLAQLLLQDIDLNKDISLFSGGQLQRLALIRSLLIKPTILLLDEPTASLDAKSSEAVENCLSQLAESGLGYLWITHDQKQGMRIANRHLRLTSRGLP